MKRLLLLISTLLPLVLLPSCSDPSTAGPSDIPNMAVPNIYTEIPNCVLADAQNSLAKKMSTMENNLLDFYKPIPLYMRMIDSAQIITQNLINELSSDEIPANSNFKHNGNDVVTVMNPDSSGQNYYSIAINGKNETLSMSYFKNGNQHYNVAISYKLKATGNTMKIDFNNQESHTTSAIKIIVPNATAGDAKAISVKLIQNGDSIMQLTGGAYIPENDLELRYDPKYYMFKAHINRVQNIAAMSVALVPEGATKDEFFTTYALDNVIIDMYIDYFKTTFTEQPNLAKAVKWSITNKDSVPFNDPNNPKWLEIILTDISNFSNNFDREQLLEFSKYNYSTMKNNTDLKQLVYVIETRQPIYYKSNATIFGNGFDSVPAGLYGISNDSIEVFKLSDIQ